MKYYASEIDKYAMKVTQNNFPNTWQLGDVQKIDTLMNTKGGTATVDLLVGGSPCQDVSFAG